MGCPVSTTLAAPAYLIVAGHPDDRHHGGFRADQIGSHEVQIEAIRSSALFAVA